jgi:hypothetical protein
MEEEKIKKEENSQETFDRYQKSESGLQEEIQAGEWKRLGEFETYRKRSRQGKILATLQALTNRILELEKMFYELVRNHPSRAVKLLDEIKRLRFLKEYLLQSLIWEEQGEFDAHDIPLELEDLL